MQPFMVAISPHHSLFLASHLPDSVSPHPRSIPLSEADRLAPTVAIVAVATPPSLAAIPPLPGHFLASRQLALSAVTTNSTAITVPTFFNLQQPPPNHCCHFRQQAPI